jgi:hypothetical protein
MKTIILLFGFVALVSCNQGGSSSNNNPAPAGDNPDTVVLQQNSLPIFANAWGKKYGNSTDGGTSVIKFSDSKISFSNYCNDGLSVSIVVAARVDNTSIQVLENKERKAEGNGRVCSVFSRDITSTYTIQGGQLIIGTDVLDRY